jgi:hypothetical protein
MLVGSYDRAIDIMYSPIQPSLRIGLLLGSLKEALPETGFAPTIEAAGHRAPGAIAFREIAPGGAGADDPENAVEDAAVVSGWAARVRFLWRKQGL